MPLNHFYQQFFDLLNTDATFVCVTLTLGLGSIPQEPGAKMLVTCQGLLTGTIGGGKLEQKAIEKALTLLREENQSAIHSVEWNLNRDVGMTCGGSVQLVFEVFNHSAWNIVVYGAGHVAQALIPILLTLDCHVTCIDSRQDWLAKLPDSPKLTPLYTPDLATSVTNLPENAFIILMTMGHASDLPILLEILRTRQFPYLGAIGSKAKAVQFKKDILEAGLPENCLSSLHCPIGLELGNNMPAEIAISIAAQLLKIRDQQTATI